MAPSAPDSKMGIRLLRLTVLSVFIGRGSAVHKKFCQRPNECKNPDNRNANRNQARTESRNFDSACDGWTESSNRQRQKRPRQSIDWRWLTFGNWRRKPTQRSKVRGNFQAFNLAKRHHHQTKCHGNLKTHAWHCFNVLVRRTSRLRTSRAS